MISLFVADDEIEIIEGVKSVIDWESHDIYICGEADNGATALKLIEELSPDIVLMDVKMPIMDGLKVLEEINSRAISAKCLILSGYDDFYFAQKAMGLNAYGYLLKPCSPDEILRSVLKVKNIIEEETYKEVLLKKYENNFYKNIPLLKEKLLREFLHGNAPNSINLAEKLDLYKIDINQSNMVVILFRINSVYEKYDSSREVYEESMKIAIGDIVNRLLPTQYSREVFQYGEDLAIVLSYENETDWNLLVNSILMDIKCEVKKSIHINTILGAGQPVKNISSIWKSYQKAIAAIESGTFIGEDDIIYFGEIETQSLRNNPYPVNEDMAIINCLTTGNNIVLEEKTSDFFKALYNGSIVSKGYVESSCFILMGSVLRFCIEKNLEINNSINGWYDNLLKCETLGQLQERINNIFREIIDEINGTNDVSQLIKMAIQYIKEKYDQDINLDVIARSIYITPGYLSLLFKQETGINFLDYLHKYRIQKAKELLHDNTLKIYNVSNLVGYNNEKYFSQVFKNYTGLTPKQYKDSIM